jgi:hypothetical protein
MKIISWKAMDRTDRDLLVTFIFSPYLSARSLSHNPGTDKSTIIRFITFLFLMTISIVLINNFLNPLSYLEVMLFAPGIYFFTEVVGAFGQLLFHKRRTFPIHGNPLMSSSLSRFWGHDWNLWVQDWLRDVSQAGTRKRNKKRIIIVFLISGLFHEIMINLPYWLIYKKSYFGTMLAYFFIQAVALWIDKRYVRHWPPLLRRVYLWVAVIIPSPLFINVPLLTFFGLEHG